MTSVAERPDPDHRPLDQRGIIGCLAPPVALFALLVCVVAWTVHGRNAVRQQAARERLARAEPDWRFEQLRDPRLTNVRLDAKIAGDRWYVDAEPVDDERPFDDAMRAEVAAFIERMHVSSGVAWRGEIPSRR